MYGIIKIFNFIFDLFFAPFKNLSPIWALIVISLITGVVMLIIFRYVSNQEAIKKAKDKIKAHIFELVLYRDNLKIIFKALLKIFKYNAIYLKQTIIPLVVIIFPVAIILIQINYRYQFRPLSNGETVLVKLKLNAGAEQQNNVALSPTNEIAVETPVLYIPGNREFDWRIKIKKPGAHQLLFNVDNQQIIKSVATGSHLNLISPAKVKNSFFKLFFNPTEKPLPDGTAVESIEINYPDQQLKIFGKSVHWLVVFFIVSLIAAFGLKGVFGVEL